MRYRATRSLHYIDVDGAERTVQDGGFVVKASAGKIEALLADGFVEAVKPDKASEKEGD
jgi:hypothetical protein